MEIKLEFFEGPLELLYNQLKKNKISIYDIEISVITDQYISAIEMLSLDNISEFVLLAAELISIKSKMLLWTPKDPDPREELANRLEIYEFFREIAQELKAMENSGRAYRSNTIESVESLSVNQGIANLGYIYRYLLKSLEEVDSNESVIPIEREEYSIEDKIHMLKNIFAIERKTKFFNIISNVKSKMEIVTVFMALLELIRDNYIEIEQSDNFTDINIIYVG